MLLYNRQPSLILLYMVFSQQSLDLNNHNQSLE
nr:MAG TPA: hypothetical protein [Caudoviricetes sp.]